MPAELLRAIGWAETRWQMVSGAEEFPGVPAAHGVMALRGERLERGAALAGERPDVVLLDLSLPGKDGWTLATALKAEPATRPIPIIGLTAHAMPGDRERALQAGCDEYESKPVDFPRLLRKMDVMLGAAAVSGEGGAPAGELAGTAGD